MWTFEEEPKMVKKTIKIKFLIRFYLRIGRMLSKQINVLDTKEFQIANYVKD